jgi:CBS domain-containing protein
LSLLDPERLLTQTWNLQIVEAVRLMLQNRISGMPVVDRQGTLAGVVTEGDFLRRAESATQRKRVRWIEFFMGQG